VQNQSKNDFDLLWSAFELLYVNFGGSGWISKFSIFLVKSPVENNCNMIGRLRKVFEEKKIEGKMKKKKKHYIRRM